MAKFPHAKKVAVCVALLVVVLVVTRRSFHRASPAKVPEAAIVAGSEAIPRSAIYGRVTSVTGAVYEGRMRWGGNQEALWGNYFSGYKSENPWAGYVKADQLPVERRPFEIFGLRLGVREIPANLSRVFMVRFGDIARIDGGVQDVRVKLKDGFGGVLNRSDAGDFDDGVRVWDVKQGVKNLDTLEIRSIEFLPAKQAGSSDEQLYGTVHTRQGDFRGFLQWDREECLGSDEIEGTGETRFRFDTVRAIARRSAKNREMTLTMKDGRTVEFTRNWEGPGRGIYVDDVRYGRVKISWNAFQSVTFEKALNAPTYDDFVAGGPLTGVVVTHDGKRLSGRIVFDLDESESVETLDAPIGGVDYNIPFALIDGIGMDGVTLRSGEKLALERKGDLGAGNGGVLVFADGQEKPEYVLWKDVEMVRFSPATR